MAYNYTNLGNQPLALFGGLPNANGATTMQQHHHHQSYMNQLAATSLAGTTHTAAAATVNAQNKRDNERTPPEPPPAPILGSLALSSSSSSLSPKMTQNQGHAPMDLENDSEPETTTTPTLMTSSTAAATATTTTGISTTNNALGTTASKPSSLHMHEPNLFLNGLLSTPSLSAAAYMFFPGAQAAAATTNAATAAATANPMLMDATAMMAAMQHMQSYAGYNMAADATAAAAADGSTQVAAGLVDAYGGASTAGGTSATAPAVKEVIKTKGCVLFPPNPNAPPPTIRDRPPGCRTVFVGGLPENITEEIIHEIFDPCGEITTLRMSKKNFCHIRYRHESSIDRAIYLSGYRVRISNGNEQANFGRLHVDYAQARDDQYEYECKQRQMQREQRHRERMSLDRLRSQSPPPMPHYTDHEASMVAENLRNNDTFLKAVQTITVWLERGDCTKRNANVFYSMIQSTHAHVRRLHTDKQQLEDELRKARESYRKQMLTMSTQFTQIEKVFNAASHKKVWDHFTKAQRKNIDQWKKLATELRSVQIEDDEMEMSDDDRDYSQSTNSHAKRTRYDHDSLKEENDSLRCQLEAIRNEMSMERTDIKYDSDFREKQIKVLQETIRNMQTQLMQTKMREQKDGKTISELELRLKEAGVKQLLLKTKIKETYSKLKDKETISSVTSETSETLFEDVEEIATAANMPEAGSEIKGFDIAKSLVTTVEVSATADAANVSPPIIDIDVYKSDDDVKIIEEHATEDGTLYKDELKATKKLEESEILTSHNKEVETTTTPTATVCSTQQFALNEAKVIALTAAYLVVQPFGVSSRTICGYLNRLMQSSLSQQYVNAQQLNDTLSKYGNLFTTISTQSPTPMNNDKGKHLSSDVSATDTKDTVEDLIWKFCGFQQASDEA